MANFLAAASVVALMIAAIHMSGLSLALSCGVTFADTLCAACSDDLLNLRGAEIRR
ncbi:hypothetical protein [Bradyrhizobium australiense]|uniref:hypothetical protein n=1 Tax=Bradyrhizobium australiense TaxID=2721161 RepID=UPI001492288D|nr:hypothetical protein [Bradyrhizobium australiense]